MFSTLSDPYLMVAFVTGTVALALTVLLVLLTIALRISLRRREKHDLQFTALWRPVLMNALVDPAACDLPVLSTSYRGADVQLRVRQPLYKNLVSLDLAVGPRFLFSGPSASPGFSIGGEAWVEATPVSYLFGRVGGRVSRLQVSNGTALTVLDTRMFFALEVGAYF